MTEVVLALVGIAAGALAATLGIGGGVIFVPTLALIGGFEQQLAQGTSLAIIIPTTLIGAIVHARAKRVDWAKVTRVGLGGIVGGLAGAQLALNVDESLLRRLFAVFLLLMAFRMLGRTRRRAHD